MTEEFPKNQKCNFLPSTENEMTVELNVLKMRKEWKRGQSIKGPSSGEA